jgi:hypothetical protein
MIHPTKPAPTIDVPFPEELIGSRVVIQGASGAGKPYAIRRILESTHARMQHFVLDVEDELFTLRERFDYVLIGGDGADAPISEDTAEELARALLELGVSAILQLNDLGLAGQRRVIAHFLTGLMKAPRQLWHPVLVTLDEAHRYAPQNGVVASSEPIVNLATAGRKRGFGALFATQRLSQLSKDVLGQCPNRIMGRVDQSLDRRVAADTLGFSPSSAEARRLMKLAHEFWVVGPAFAPEPRLIRFSPAVTTPTPLPKGPRQRRGHPVVTGDGQWRVGTFRPSSGRRSMATSNDRRHSLAGSLHMGPTRRPQRPQGAGRTFQHVAKISRRARFCGGARRQGRADRRRVSENRRAAQGDARDARRDA